MPEGKMSRDEIERESRRIAELIRKSSEPGLRAVAEMSKRSFSLEYMRAQVIRHQIEGNWLRKYKHGPIPLKVEMKVQRRIAKVLERGYSESFFRLR